MMGLVNFIQKRPTDKTILLVRIIFGLLYIGIMYYNLIFLNKEIDTEYIFGTLVLDQNLVIIVKYIMISIGIFPLFMGITNICLLKKKYLRIVQIISSFLIFYIASSIKENAYLDFDVIIGFMGILPLISGISGKCITSKCIKYKEKITKIRI